MPPWGGLFNSKKDNASDGSISPTPNSKREKRKEKQSISGHGMGNLREYTSHDDPRMYHLRNGVDPRSNGRFIDMHGMGFSSREEPEFIRSRLMGQFQSSLNTAVTDSIRKACIHWDDEVLHLENSYQSVLEERNGLKTENKNLANRVKLLEAEVNNKVALLREFQSGHLKTAGSRKLAPSSSAISTEYEGLERRIKDTVFARLARLDIKDPYIETLLHHQPFLEAVKGIMVDATEAQEAENVPLNLLEVVEEAEKKGLLMWMIQGVVHDILHKKIMKIHMPGLNIEELQVMEKIFNIIALSEDGQGMRSAQEWRADTYRRLAYWAENVEELGKYIEAAPAISEMSQIFGDLIDGTEKEITRILEPLCDQSPEGNNFSRLVVDIVDRAFQFSILIGSQTARYELHRDLDHTDDFKAVPDHLDESAANNSNVSLFYGVPALVKTSSEDGEAYDVSELLVHGKIYVLFGFGDSIEEEEQRVAPPEVPEKIPIQMASPVNGGDIDSHDTEAITKAKTSQRTVAETPDETKAEPKSIATDSRTDRNIDLQRHDRVERPTAEARAQRRHRHDDLQQQRERAVQGDPRYAEQPIGSGSRRHPAPRNIHADGPSDNRPGKPKAPTSSYPEVPDRTLGKLAQQRSPIARKEVPESRSPPDRNSSLPKPPQATVDSRTNRPSPTGGPGSHPRTSMSGPGPSQSRNRPSPSTSGEFNSSSIAYSVGSNRGGGDPPSPSTSRNSAGTLTRKFDVVNTSETRSRFAERARAAAQLSAYEQQQRDLTSAVHAAHLATRTNQLEQQLRQQQGPSGSNDPKARGGRH
ncbi:hypothetical protein TWF106_001433 [Orbilia oligospora]|uniref:Uncharacterized protein n=1 Tax=Orbilia oligospora TaxID=2813651 RepID=A0A7C8QBN3_ORBOL|nr:hypothetical protein TWF106_001433 [Orbilia oligospora]KAF3214432.1 hypothetical protein TWF679_004806 [Orbilia oligospora]